MRIHLTLLVVLVLMVALCHGACATEWFVATNGNDANAGDIAHPFATLNEAVLNHAQPGDTVSVRAGTYTGLMNINGPGTGGSCATPNPTNAVIGGAPGAPITIRSYDGDFAAQFTGGVRVVRCKYLTLTGLDMRMTGTSGHPLSIISGCEDYATADKRSNNIQVVNCRVHDGGSNSGQLKVQQSDYITVQDCELWNIGAGGAALDCVWVNYCTMRRNYLHDSYTGGFFKGGSQYSVFDSNVYVNPISGQIVWGFLPGGQTDPAFANPNVLDESQYTVIRNNIIRGATRGAVGSEDSCYCYVYNNLFHDCATGNSYYPYVTQITVGRGQASRNGQWTRHFYVRNNIFLDSTGDLKPYGYASGNYEDWQTSNSNFWNQGQPLEYESGFINPNNEAGATFTNPNLTLSGTPTTWQGWVDYYRPTPASAAIIDHGSSLASGTPQPAVLVDIEGNARPQGAGWEIGPYEYVAAPQPPVANFTGNPTSGAVPLTVAFTDASSGAPTSWSWNFGDGGASTAQSPSHTYTSANSYTVSLTATNAQGSDNETKPNYITAIQAQDYTCASLTVDKGTLKSGDHTSVHSSDNVYLVIGSAKVANKQTAQVSYTMNTGLGSLSYLTATVESKVSAGTQPLTVYAYNYSTSSWTSIATGTLTTTDSTVNPTVSNPSQYLSGGTVQVRVKAGGSGSTAFDHSTDLVKITAAP